MAAWTLTDNSTGTPEVLTFSINPNKFDPPGYAPNVSQHQATAPGSPAIVFTGRMSQPNGKFAGIIHTQAWYGDADEWFTKWYPMVLTDDEGSSWNILITGYEKTRLKRAINRWRYDYTVDFMEI